MLGGAVRKTATARSAPLGQRRRRRGQWTAAPAALAVSAIPRANANERAGAPSREMTKVSSRVSFAGHLRVMVALGGAMRILVIEDEPRILAFLARGLEAEGFAVDGAGNGPTGSSVRARRATTSSSSTCCCRGSTA